MALSDLLFDRRCKLCGKRISTGAVCDVCNDILMSSVVLKKRKFKVCQKEITAMYLFDYDNEAVKKLLFALKRSANKELFEYAAMLYEKALENSFTGCATYAPRRDFNTRNYGYDHVKEPVRIMCKNNKDRLVFKKLIKSKRRSADQKTLSAIQRAENVKDAFTVRKNDIPKNIVLVDDVVTTGSTVCACAEEILKVDADINISFAFLASRSVFSGKG